MAVSKKTVPAKKAQQKTKPVVPECTQELLSKYGVPEDIPTEKELNGKRFARFAMTALIGEGIEMQMALFGEHDDLCNSLTAAMDESEVNYILNSVSGKHPYMEILDIILDKPKKEGKTLFETYRKLAAKEFNMPSVKLCSDADIITYLKKTKLSGIEEIKNKNNKK